MNLKSVGGQEPDGELVELDKTVEETLPPVVLWRAKDRLQIESLATWVVQFSGLGLSNLQVGLVNRVDEQGGLRFGW